ncbi:aminoglycoside phosphotransferase family protein [Paenibacillus daejeonensis]|uniref:aminoglycoside phosphotransferase family protein n=1 Tax=Paenibacillus daejeonensis TaxID=135193 RepID=UPI000376C0A4|nr:aminoglycoside phosphotransferase family protein [Paenibacillus daejeonensis]
MKYTVIASGRSADILSLGDHQVLKLFNADLPEQLIHEEFAISNSVYKLGIDCPAPINITEYNGRIGIIYTRVHGMTMLNLISKKFWRLSREAIRLARIHLRIHSHTISNIPKQKEVLSERIIQAPILLAKEKQQIFNHMNQLKDDTKLCHGDFHPDNIILSEQNEWIIDWMTGMEGNPAGDVARSFLILKLGRLSEKTPKLISTIGSQIRHLISSKYLDEYLKNSMISKHEVDDWMIPVAAARLNERIPEVEKQELVELIRKRIG